MTNAKKAPTTAAETYAAKHVDIARLIDVLQMELAKDAERAAAAPNDWGFPGNLGRVRRDLIDTIAFLSQMDATEIEAFLDEKD